MNEFNEAAFFARKPHRPSKYDPPRQDVPGRSWRVLLSGAAWRHLWLRLWLWLRFGRITEHIRAIDGGVVSEIEFQDRFGRVIGYWAYGSYDPGFPYRGQR